MSLPEFKQMSKAVKDDLTSRFKPECCPKCRREAAYFTTRLNIQEVISSVPNWNINCQFCGVEYQVRIVSP